MELRHPILHLWASVLSGTLPVGFDKVSGPWSSCCALGVSSFNGLLLGFWHDVPDFVMMSRTRKSNITNQLPVFW